MWFSLSLISAMFSMARARDQAYSPIVVSQKGQMTFIACFLSGAGGAVGTHLTH